MKNDLIICLLCKISIMDVMNLGPVFHCPSLPPMSYHQLIMDPNNKKVSQHFLLLLELENSPRARKIGLTMPEVESTDDKPNCKQLFTVARLQSSFS